MADDLLKYKKQFQQNLNSRDAITVEELQICANLNPYRDWFVSILNDANALQDAVDEEFMHELEMLQMA